MKHWTLIVIMITDENQKSGKYYQLMDTATSALSRRLYSYHSQRFIRWSPSKCYSNIWTLVLIQETRSPSGTASPTHRLEFLQYDVRHIEYHCVVHKVKINHPDYSDYTERQSAASFPTSCSVHGLQVVKSVGARTHPWSTQVFTAMYSKIRPPPHILYQIQLEFSRIHFGSPNRTSCCGPRRSWTTATGVTEDTRLSTVDFLRVEPDCSWRLRVSRFWRTLSMRVRAKTLSGTARWVTNL